MITRFLKKFLIPISALAIVLACGPFAAATPQPAATLNALYTAAAQTLESMSTQGAYYTFTPLAIRNSYLIHLHSHFHIHSLFPCNIHDCSSASTGYPLRCGLLYQRCDLPGRLNCPLRERIHQNLASAKYRYLYLELILCAGFCWRRKV